MDLRFSNKKSEKKNGKKKKDVKESGVETLNGVVCDANAVSIVYVFFFEKSIHNVKHS